MSNYSYHLSQDSEGLQAVTPANYPEYAGSSPQPPVWSKPDGSPGMDSTVTAVPATTASTIWGIPRKTFIIAVIIAIGIIIAGALGGGIGGGLSSSNSSSSSTPTHAVTVTATATAATCAATSSSSFQSSSTSYSDCPDSNDTTYTSTKFSKGSNGPVPKGATNGLEFTKNCGSDYTGDNLAQASVSSFNDCIDLCASYNFWNGTTNCKAASYRVEDGDCWIIGGN